MRTQLVDGLLTDLLQVEIFMCGKPRFRVETHNLKRERYLVEQLRERTL